MPYSPSIGLEAIKILEGILGVRIILTSAGSDPMDDYRYLGFCSKSGMGFALKFRDGEFEVVNASQS